MDINITGKNMELLPAVQDYAVRKLDKINRILRKILDFDVELSQENTRSPQQHFVAQVTVNANGTLLRGEERGQDVYTAIDKVAVVMHRQAEHYKGKLYEKGRGTSPLRGVAPLPTTPPPPPEPEEIPETMEVNVPPRPKVVRTKKFTIKPMSIDEAVDQMELLGHDFFIFRDAVTSDINLIYRRKDGNIGVIETTPRK